MTQHAIAACSRSLGITLSPITGLETLPPTGRIRSCIGNWKQISDDSWILEVMMGYHLELAHMPQQWSSPQERSLKEAEQEMVSEEVVKLLLKQAGQRSPKPVSERPISGSEERWVTTPSDQLEAPEPFSVETEVQDGGCQSHQGHPSEGRLDGLHRFEGCIPIGPSGQGRQAVPEVQMEGDTLRIPVPAVWSEQHASSVHQAAETSGCSFQKTGHTLHHLSGRPANHVADTEGPEEDLSGCSHPSPSTGLPDQLGKKCTQSDPGNPVLGSPSRLNTDDGGLANGQAEGYCSVMQSSQQERQHLNSRPSLSDWQDDSHSNGSPPSTPVLQEPPTAEEPGSPHQLGRLRCQGSPGPGCKRGVAMVDTQTPAVEQKAVTAPLSRPDDRDRCFSTGLGGSSQRGEYRRSLVRGGTPESYQSPGDVGCSASSTDIHKGQDSVSCTSADGQPDGSVLHQPHQPHGRNQVYSISHSLQTVGVVSGERSNSFSRIPSRITQCGSRPGITDTPVVCRMETGQDGVSGSVEPIRPMQCRPVRVEAEFPASSLHQLEARPTSNDNGCIFSELERPPGVCLPPICPNRQMPTEDTTGGVNSGINSPSVAIPVMVSMATGNVGLGPSTSASPQESSARPFQQGTPPATQGATATSCLESVRHACSLSGISERATNIISAGWRRGTNSAYQSGWIKWTGWCSTRGLNSLSCSVQHFLDFLTELFDSGLQHRTINVVGSAVSMTHKEVEGIPIGQHPLVTRLMKGVYNLRPPKPQYTYTWDVDMVIQYIAGLGENTNLPAKKLSQKLVLLMALVVASRTSELQALDLRFRVYRPNGVLFRLANITKTQKAGTPSKEHFFGAFLDKRLCVVECLKCYEEMTLKHRDTQAEVQPLFLSYIKPFKPVTSQRIAHWIKDILSEAGVDTRVFKAHSVRGASVSASKNKGVGIPDILDMADWSRDTIFRRFYYRTTTSNVYTQSVLRVSDGK